eukprot:1418879-Prymnesium_polylepis.1
MADRDSVGVRCDQNRACRVRISVHKHTPNRRGREEGCRCARRTKFRRRSAIRAERTGYSTDGCNHL